MTEPPSESLPGTSRREVRHMTVLIIGKVSGVHGEYACVVKNLSSHGLKARFPRRLAVGERLTFTFRGAPALAATVRWMEDLDGGVEFDTPLDLNAIRESYGTARLPRPPRFACHCQSRLTLDGCDHQIGILDVSLGGAKLAIGHAAVPPGHSGNLILPVIEQSRCGTVRWHDGDRIGFQFAVPLTIDMLSHVLSDRPLPIGSP